MSDGLPKVHARQRLEITEESLAEAPAATAPPAAPSPGHAPAQPPRIAKPPSFGNGSAPTVPAGRPAVGAKAGMAVAPPAPTVLGPASYCRACGTGLDPRAVVCPSCGVPAREQPAQPSPVAVAALTMNQKSPGTAIVLSLLFTGAGQVYCNRVGRGIAFFCAAIFSAMLIFFVIGLFLLPIVWIWAAFDANHLAHEHNQRLLTSAHAAYA